MGNWIPGNSDGPPDIEIIRACLCFAYWTNVMFQLCWSPFFFCHCCQCRNFTLQHLLNVSVALVIKFSSVPPPPRYPLAPSARLFRMTTFVSMTVKRGHLDFYWKIHWKAAGGGRGVFSNVSPLLIIIYWGSPRPPTPCPWTPVDTFCCQGTSKLPVCF